MRHPVADMWGWGDESFVAPDHGTDGAGHQGDVEGGGYGSSLLYSLIDGDGESDELDL